MKLDVAFEAALWSEEESERRSETRVRVAEAAESTRELTRKARASADRVLAVAGHFPDLPPIPKSTGAATPERKTGRTGAWRWSA